MPLSSTTPHQHVGHTCRPDPLRWCGLPVTWRCSEVYIGKTERSMQDRIKECYYRDIWLTHTQTSAQARPWDRPLSSLERGEVYWSRPSLVHTQVHIRLHPNNINRDSEIEIPRAWMPMIKEHNNKRMVQQWSTEGTTSHRNNRTIGDRNVPITAHLCDINGTT